MLPGGNRIICMIERVFPGLDLYCTDLAQHIIRAGSDLEYLSDGDISDLFEVSNLVSFVAYLCARI